MDGKTQTQARKVVVFECAGATADHVVVAHRGARTIRVPCSGKLQPEHLLKAFEAGTDLAVVLTCREGDCRYLEGRQRIERRLDYVRGLLDEIGLGGNRLVLLDRMAETAQDNALEALTAGLSASPLTRNAREGV